MRGTHVHVWCDMGGIHGGRNIEKVHGDGMGHHGSELRIHSCDQIDGLGSQVAEEVKARKVLDMGVQSQCISLVPLQQRHPRSFEFLRRGRRRGWESWLGTFW